MDPGDALADDKAGEADANGEEETLFAGAEVLTSATSDDHKEPGAAEPGPASTSKGRSYKTGPAPALDSGRQDSEGRGRFASPFYFCNALVLASYAVVRLTLSHDPDAPPILGWSPEYLERQALMMLAPFVVLQLRHGPTLEDALAKIVRYGKLMVLGLSLMLSGQAFAWYLLTFVAMEALCTQTLWRPIAPGGLREMAPRPLADFLAVRHTGPGPAPATVVVFYAAGSGRCVRRFPMLSVLAARYETPALRFASADVGTWPRLATEYRLVDPGLSGAHVILPAVVLFVHGKEVARLQDSEEDVMRAMAGRGSGAVVADRLSRDLELDRRHAASFHAAGEGRWRRTGRGRGEAGCLPDAWSR